MIDRRQVLTMGGLLGALAPGGTPDEGVGTGQVADRQVQEIVSAINNLGNRIGQLQSFAEVSGVRKSQYDYLRANGKFPDFIDIGLDVWAGIYDWHVRMQQPLVLGRDASGHYTMMLAFTTLVLHQEAVPAYISIPYDQR